MYNNNIYQIVFKLIVFNLTFGKEISTFLQYLVSVFKRTLYWYIEPLVGWLTCADPCIMLTVTLITEDNKKLY